MLLVHPSSVVKDTSVSRATERTYCIIDCLTLCGCAYLDGAFVGHLAVEHTGLQLPDSGWWELEEGELDDR